MLRQPADNLLLFFGCPGLPLPSVFVWLLVVLFLLSLGGVALVSALALFVLSLLRVLCLSVLASWLNFRFHLASSLCGRSWIMLKAVRFTTTWLGQLCISTTWRGSYPFPSRPLNMKNLYLQQIFVWNVHQPGAYTPLYPCRHRKPLQPWRHMEASLPIW